MALALTIGSTASGRDQLRCQRNNPTAAAISSRLISVKYRCTRRRMSCAKSTPFSWRAPSTWNNSTKP